MKHYYSPFKQRNHIHEDFYVTINLLKTCLNHYYIEEIMENVWDRRFNNEFFKKQVIEEFKKYMKIISSLLKYNQTLWGYH